jgi:bromodomain-containing protein 8
MRTTKPRRHKRVSTETPASPPTVDEETEVDPNTEANDTDAMSEGHPMEDDTPASSRRRDGGFDLHVSQLCTDLCFPGKRKASLVEGIESPRDKKRARDDSEPADEDEIGKQFLYISVDPLFNFDSGPNSNASRGVRRRGDRTEEQAAFKRFQNVIIMLHTQISQHRNGNIFHNPIKTSEAPDYHEIVKQPTDLKKIKMKIKDGTISNSLEFKRDIFQMFANAMMYNRPGSDVHIMAEDVGVLFCSPFLSMISFLRRFR